jgi:hypothetical protein
MAVPTSAYRLLGDTWRPADTIGIPDALCIAWASTTGDDEAISASAARLPAATKAGSI